MHLKGICLSKKTQTSEPLPITNNQTHNTSDTKKKGGIICVRN